MKRLTLTGYALRRVHDRDGYDYARITWPRQDGNAPEYRLTAGQEAKEMRQLRREIRQHMDHPGATMGNYQW